MRPVSWDNVKGPAIDRSAMHVYTCKNCGAQVLSDGLSATGRCMYCNSEFVLTDKFENVMMPEGIIPFEQTVEYARMTMRRLASEKTGIPEKDFKEEWLTNMQGCYIPCWLFDCSTSVCGVYFGTEVRQGFDMRYGPTTLETEYTITRIGTIQVKNIPARADSRLKETTVMKLFPFYLKDMQPFNPALLTGYSASLYDISPEAEKEKIEKDIELQATADLAATIHHGSLRTVMSFANINSAQYGYCLLPIWICRFNYMGYNYKFCMNGQTGEAMIELPPGAAEAIRKKHQQKSWLLDGLIAIPIASLIPITLLFGDSLPRLRMFGFYGSTFATVAVFIITYILRKIKYKGYLSEREIQHDEKLLKQYGKTWDDFSPFADPEGLNEGSNAGVHGTSDKLKLEVATDELYGTRTYAIVADGSGNSSRQVVNFKEGK
jgi:DNA-directed RNA polymerase subunit RPC12/RpoP